MIRDPLQIRNTIRANTVLDIHTDYHKSLIRRFEYRHLHQFAQSLLAPEAIAKSLLIEKLLLLINF